MPLPWMHFRPASITLHFDESIMIGTRAISGSLAIRFRKRTIAAWLSSMASSMLTSITCAPFSTCWRATLSASSKRPSRIMRAKALDPVTLVRSPMLTNSEPASSRNGSRPDNNSGAIGVLSAGSVMGGSRASACLEPPGSPVRLEKAWVSAVASRRCRRLWPEPGSTLDAVATLLEPRRDSTKMGDTSSPDTGHKPRRLPWLCAQKTP